MPDQPLMMADGTPVKRRLKDLGFSQDEAATRIGIGASQLNPVLNGHKNPGLETLMKLGRIVQGPIQIGDQVIHILDRDTGEKRLGGKPYQYPLGYDQPVELQVNGGLISVEVSRKPVTSEVELRVRLPQTKVAG